MTIELLDIIFLVKNMVNFLFMLDLLARLGGSGGA